MNLSFADLLQLVDRAIARALIGGCIFIYSGSVRLTSFEINFISKETSRAEHEYMNIHPPPPISALATTLLVETTCSKPVDNKFIQSTCNTSVENLSLTSCHKLCKYILISTCQSRFSQDVNRLKSLVRLHGEYNNSSALWKHHVNLLLQSFPSISLDLQQC